MGILESAFGMKGTYLDSIEEYRKSCTRRVAAEVEKYGTCEHRTPEQQAALDALRAKYHAETIEIRTDEDMYNYLCDEYIASHGQVEFEFGAETWNADWDIVRRMAKERGYVEYDRFG